MNLKRIEAVPVFGKLFGKALNTYLKAKRKRKFTSSTDFWKKKYQEGGHSGYGSYNQLALFKAEVLNGFIGANKYTKYVEFGSGDGNQLELISYPEYKGFDISELCIQNCTEKYKGDESKSFALMSDYDGEKFDVSLSLDVIFHLVEDEVYNQYLSTLFNAATSAVIVYSSNTNDNSDNFYPQVKHRKFTDDVADRFPEFKLVKTTPNKYPYDGDSKVGSFSDFYFFEKS